jgi:hypothetical protein
MRRWGRNINDKKKSKFHGESNNNQGIDSSIPKEQVRILTLGGVMLGV